MLRGSLFLLPTIVFSLSLDAAIFRVKSDATGAGDGSTWADAFPKLQDALGAAAPNDQIWVAAGIYYPDEGVGQADNDRTSSFVLDQDINLYGGFDGTELTLFARDLNPATNITVLSGDLDQNDGSKDADGVITDPDLIAGDNSYHVVTVEGGTADVRIDGFTITGGNRETSGGGPDLRSGAGIYALIFDSLDIASCRIQGNRSEFGGGLFISGSDVDVTLCSFLSNRGTSGGAYYGNNGSSIAFRSCVFAGNAAVRGGGAYIASNSTNQFINCTFHGNSGSTDLGSGIHDLGSASELVNCVVWNSFSTDGPLDEIDNNGTGSLSFSHTLVQHQDLSASGSNLDGTDPANDPLFLDPLVTNQAPQVWDDFRQASNSPINDVGDNTPVFLIVDIVGRARIFNTTIDLGAVEYQPWIWHVDAGATGVEDGTSWAAAFTDLQDALAASINGDEIWLAAGIYRPGDGSDRNASFVIDKTIQLYGGFAGTETNREDRAPAVNVTVLSGDLDQNDTTNAAGITTDPAGLTGNNAFTVCRVWVPVNGDYNTEPVLLTGVTITGGLGGSSGGGLNVGGGACDTDLISCRIRGNSSVFGGGLLANLNSRELRMSNLIVRDNHATTDGGGMNLGSGVTDPALANIRLNGINFINNESDDDGGAIQHTGGLLVEDCTFTDNQAFDGGGALSSNFGARVYFDNCAFNTNTADVGGALELRPHSEVVGTSFDGNTASRGGAIWGETDLQIDDCTFTSNETTAGGIGGGAIEATSTTLTRSSFTSNLSATSGGALRLVTGTSWIENCLFSGNDGSNGGAAHVLFASADFVNCAFSGNTAGTGGGVRFDNATSGSLINCSFQGNSALIGGAVNVASSTVALSNTVAWTNAENGSIGVAGASIYVDPSSTATYTHCLLENLNPAGVGNLDGTNAANDPDFTTETNPLAAPATGGDLRLQSGSPAIDQGLNSANDTTLELDGLLRFAGAAIDLGAYEFGSGTSVTFASLFPTLGPDDDENGNGLSNYLDYALGTDPTGAFDPSGQVLLQGNSLTLPSRAGAADVFVTWEKSSTLGVGSWSDLVEGVDYTVTSSDTVGIQTITEIELLGVTPPIFFRQSFATTP